MKNWLDHRKVHKTVDIDIKEDTVSRFLTAINHKPVRTTFTILWDPSLVSFMASAFCCTLSMTCPRRGVVATRLRCTRCLLWPPWRLCEPRGNSEARRARLGSQKELRHSGDLQDGGCSFLNPNQLIWGGGYFHLNHQVHRKSRIIQSNPELCFRRRSCALSLFHSG